MSSTREGLEAALAANPDDVAIHAAYADLLIEEDDPRGEYIQLSLAIEDRNQAPDRLRGMEQRAYEIRGKHEQDWLGPLGPFVCPSPGSSVWAMTSNPPVDVSWHRGWIDVVLVHQLTDLIRDALVEGQHCRLMRELTIRVTEQHEFISLTTLFRCPNLANLKLLTVHFPGFADAGVEELVSSGLIPRLRTLDLGLCNITDEGAIQLAYGADLSTLASVDLGGNYISELGARGLVSFGSVVGLHTQFPTYDWNPDGQPNDFT